MANVYVASTLRNAVRVRALYEALRTAGHTISYDWTEHGSVYTPRATRKHNELMCEIVAGKELEGVLNAEKVIVLLPGGRGTHVEMGFALALFKPVFVAYTDPMQLHGSDGYPCSFYHAKGVQHVNADPSSILEALAA